MKILYCGDVMGKVGVNVLTSLLPLIRAEYDVDLVIAQSENVTDGKGVSLEDFQLLRKLGVDFCTGGNWSLHNTTVVPALSDPAQPIIRPANYPKETPGLGWKYAQTPVGSLLVISLLGGIVGRDADRPTDNPLRIVDQILDSQNNVTKIGVIVNLHGDFSSEKVVIGHYLDGRASLVVGDHWHVPTADARVLPGGTAHISDVGMCGTLDSSLGVAYSSIIPRWRDGKQTRNVLETEGQKQFNAVLVDIDQSTGLASSIEQIRRII